MAAEQAAAGVMPQLGLTAGPSNATASSGGTTSTGAFNFNQPETLFQQVLPYALIGVMAWLIWKK